MTCLTKSVYGWLSVSMSVMLAACSALPTVETPVTDVNRIAPIQGEHLVSTAPRKPVNAAWWQAFGDPTLTALIQAALQHNPDLRSAQANLQAARAQVVIANASLLPGLSASASARRSQTGGSYNAGLDASWEMDWFGANQFAKQATALDAQAAQASVEDAKASIAAEVATAYVNLRLAQLRLSVAQQNLTARRETLELTQLKQTAGLVSGLDVEQARLSVGQTEAQRPALENSVARSQHALAILTGQAPDALKARLAGSGKIPTAQLQLAQKVPAQALRQRPDIRAAEYKVQAASLRVGEAKANLYPSFNLGGSLSLSSVSLPDLLDTSNVARSLLASISAPLLDNGRLKQQVVIRDASYEQALASYQKALLTALQEVANAFSSLQALRQQQPQLVANLQLARSAEQLGQLSYQAGTADFQIVLEAQRTTLSTQESLLAAQAEASLALIGLYKAVGGAW